MIEVKEEMTFSDLKEMAWSGAEDILSVVEREDKEDELINHLKEVFFDEIPTKTQVNDYLRFDWEFIVRALDLKVEEEDDDTHNCKYCGQLVEGSYEDLLCEDCRESFGHSLYSEL